MYASILIVLRRGAVEQEQDKDRLKFVLVHLIVFVLQTVLQQQEWFQIVCVVPKIVKIHPWMIHRSIDRSIILYVYIVLGGV